MENLQMSILLEKRGAELWLVRRFQITDHSVFRFLDKHLAEWWLSMKTVTGGKVDKRRESGGHREAEYFPHQRKLCLEL